jgi:hypothetical protein
MGNTRNGHAMMIAPFNPVPAVVQLAQQLGRYAELDPKTQEAASLVEARLNEIDGNDRVEYLAPLLWSWVRNIPICPPGSPWGPHRPQHSALASVEAILSDGSRLLPATEAFLEGFLDSTSLAALSNEVARWSRSTSRNTDLLEAMREEYRQFQDECGKLREQRKLGFDDAIGAVLILAGAAAIGGLIHTLSAHPR